MNVYTSKEYIKYLDVDKNNKLTNKAIINYMQNAGGEHTNINGDGIKDQPKTHLAWLILNWKIKVFDRPEYGEKITIKTWIKKTEICCCWREFEIYCNKKLIAVGDSRWVLVSTETGKITRIPAEIVKIYAPKGIGVFDEELEEKIKEPKDSQLTYEEIIGRTRIDTNNHLNNLYYLDFAIESLPEEIYEKTLFNNVEIMYKKQVKYKDKIKCFYKEENNQQIVVIKGEDEKTLHSIIKMYN